MLRVGSCSMLTTETSPRCLNPVYRAICRLLRKKVYVLMRQPRRLAEAWNTEGRRLSPIWRTARDAIDVLRLCSDGSAVKRAAAIGEFPVDVLAARRNSGDICPCREVFNFYTRGRGNSASINFEARTLVGARQLRAPPRLARHSVSRTRLLPRSNYYNSSFSR